MCMAQGETPQEPDGWEWRDPEESPTQPLLREIELPWAIFLAPLGCEKPPNPGIHLPTSRQSQDCVSGNTQYRPFTHHLLKAINGTRRGGLLQARNKRVGARGLHYALMSGQVSLHINKDEASPFCHPNHSFRLSGTDFHEESSPRC